jgi:hypothetical protein
MNHLNKESIQQYQTEERTLMALRLASNRYRVMELIKVMTIDKISTPEKLEQLKSELDQGFNTNTFKKCKSMGQVLKQNLKETLRKNLVLIQQNLGNFED